MAGDLISDQIVEPLLQRADGVDAGPGHRGLFAVGLRVGQAKTFEGVCNHDDQRFDPWQLPVGNRRAGGQCHLEQGGTSVGVAADEAWVEAGDVVQSGIGGRADVAGAKGKRSLALRAYSLLFGPRLLPEGALEAVLQRLCFPAFSPLLLHAVDEKWMLPAMLRRPLLGLSASLICDSAALVADSARLRFMRPGGR